MIASHIWLGGWVLTLHFVVVNLHYTSKGMFISSMFLYFNTKLIKLRFTLTITSNYSYISEVNLMVIENKVGCMVYKIVPPHSCFNEDSLCLVWIKLFLAGSVYWWKETLYLTCVSLDVKMLYNSRWSTFKDVSFYLG